MAPALPGSVRQSIVHQSLLKNSSLSQIDGKSPEKAKTYLGMLDTTYLFSYAFFMFFSGFVAERMNLRYFLSLGMIFRFQEILQFGWTIEIFMKCNLPSGISTWLFGFSYIAGIHSLWYLLIVQVFLASWCWSHLSHFPQNMCFMAPEKNWQYTYFEVESSLGEMCFQLVYFCKCDKTIQWLLRDWRPLVKLNFQVVTGCFQATGWPGVVSVMANWFGKVSKIILIFKWIIWPTS